MVFIAVIKLFFSTILQNASFTMVSRARNSKNISYNIFASVLSNGMWLFVAKQAILSDSWVLSFTYVIAATIGSALMQWVSIKYLENKEFMGKVGKYFKLPKLIKVKC